MGSATASPSGDVTSKNYYGIHRKINHYIFLILAV